LKRQFTRVTKAENVDWFKNLLLSSSKGIGKKSNHVFGKIAKMRTPKTFILKKLKMTS